ncbi:MAG: His/Gly/Thr/Pro-type tRNA ligase C-terminal domain-containing protein [Minicystis sp.]
MLGSQNTLCGGGRYDNMVKSLGGADVPAIGFAMGMERILLAMPETAAKTGPGAIVLPLTPEGAKKGLVLARDLRALGVVTEVDGRGGKLKNMLSRAEKRGAAMCVILGEEAERGSVAVKDLATRAQEEIPLDTAARIIADRLGQRGAGEARGSR